MSLHSRYCAKEVLLHPLKSRALWQATGGDRVRYLNGQVTCDVARIGPDHASYAAVCNAKGRMEGDLFIAQHDGIFYLDGEGAAHAELSARLQKYLIADDVEFLDLTADWLVIHLLTQEIPEGLKADITTTAGFAVSNTRYLLPGWDLWIPRAAAESFLGSHDDAIVTDNEIEALRVEFALPKWGAELTTDSLPPEVGREDRWISYQKGCYIGQEIIARLRSVGQVPRLLVQLQSAGDDFPPPGTPVSLEGKVVGHITSSLLSPRLQSGLALAIVPRALTSPGTQLLSGEIELTVREPLTP